MKLQPALFVPDAHRPYHDKRAWRLMLQVGKDLQPQHLVVIGDLADFYAVSSHSKDPIRATRFESELRDVNRGLDELDTLGASNKIYIEGNHEDRLRRYLRDKAPELYGVVGVENLLALKKRGWQFFPYKEHARLGKLYLTHDVETAGRYSVYKALDTYQHSIITGHTHRLGYVVEGNAVGEYKLSANFGWLGDRRQVNYLQRGKVNKDWALGFGVGYIHPTTGVAYLTPVPIVGYSCMVNGKLYEA